MNSIALHYESYKSATGHTTSTVMLLHGLGSSTRDWSDQIPALTPRHDVLLVDLRGHGQSDQPPGPYSIKDMANDVAMLTVKLGVTGLHVVGLSMGAQVALQLALDHPTVVSTITVVNSPACMKPRRLRDKLTVFQRNLLVQVFGMRRVGQVIAARLLPGDDFIERRRIFAERWAENDPVAYRTSFDAILDWDITPFLPRINQTMLVIAASEDYTPLEWKKPIVELAPNATLVVVEGCRHAIPVERPEVFNSILLDFLDEHPL